MNNWLIPALSVAYVGVLFAVAWWGDRFGLPKSLQRFRPVLFSLTLAVYCTSWTVYGAIGSAIHEGWRFLPIYLGPLLLLLFGANILERLALIGKTKNIASISDFISSRYGKSRQLGALAALIAVVGVLPYLALQFKAVSLSFDVLTGQQNGASGLFSDTAFFVALGMALFAILFGTRRIEATEHHRGLMLAVATESVIKLLAMVAVALFALYQLGKLDSNWNHLLADPRLQMLAAPNAVPAGFFTHTLLAFAALFCLPRQFHVTVVECEDTRHIKTARWMFSVYLLLVCLAVLPVAALALLHREAIGMTPDMAMLTLPLYFGADWLAVLAFIGGFSAATGMVLVSTVALSTMISNDLVMPLLWRWRLFDVPSRQDLSGVLKTVRRLSILLIALLGYGFYRLIEQFAYLADIGLLAFAAAAQFAPVLLGGLYWSGGSRRGAMAGLFGGFVVWSYTLLLPTLIQGGVWQTTLLQEGLFNISWLKPQALFALEGWDTLTHGVFWSLMANISLYVIVSIRSRPSLQERTDAAFYLNPYVTPEGAREAEQAGRLRVGELRAITARIIGDAQALSVFSAYAAQREEPLQEDKLADRGWIRFAERTLAGVMGAASSRMMLTTALRGTGMDIGLVIALLDQSSQEQRFNRGLLQTMMENIPQAISVVDADMRLVAWNRRYTEMFEYPDGMVYIGCPVAALIRYNAERGECGPGDVEQHVRKRLHHMRIGSAHVFERVRPDGRVIEMRGQPLPGGGFVTTFTDITHFKQAEENLRQSEHAIRVYTDNVPVLLAYMDTRLTYRFVNRAYLELIGKSREQVLGQTAYQVLSSEDIARRQPYIDGVLKGERQEFEIQLRKADGSPVYALGAYLPQFDTNQQQQGFYVIFQDISARWRAELALAEANIELEARVQERTEALQQALDAQEKAKQEAIQANQSKTRFIAAASHDLLQPLHAARLFTTALSQHDSDDPELFTLSKQIDGALRGAEELLSALLDISRLDSGALTVNRTAFPLAELFTDLRLQFAPLAATRGIQFECINTSVWVQSDRQMLRRILQNFISNALRYTRSGRVLLGVRRQAHSLRLEVWDTGPGIAPMHLRSIFEEFQRTGETSPWGEKGMGLGLAICERMARLLGHAIGVQSELGLGSMFYVEVPRAEAAVPTLNEPMPVSKGQALDGLKVLCIDNEPDILIGMKAVLGKWGCQALLAQNSVDAETQMSALPDVILADFHLGEAVDGLELLLKLSQVHGTRISGALITADHSEALAKRAKEAGITVLRKPVKPGALRAFLSAR